MSKEPIDMTLDRAVAMLTLGIMRVLANSKILDKEDNEVSLRDTTDNILECINITVKTAVGNYTEEQLDIVLQEYEDRYNSGLIYDVKDAMSEITGVYK